MIVRNDKKVSKIYRGEETVQRIYKGTDKVYEYLPVGYKECKYLESTGTQYIDTGVLSKSTLKVILDASVVSIIGGKGNAIFGVNNVDGGSFAYQINGNTKMLRCDFNKTASQSSYKVTENTRHLWKKDKNVNYVDNTIIYTNASSEFQTQLSMYLFGKNATSDFGLSKLKVFNCEIYDSDILVRNFIPVLDKDGVPCLYDKVEDKFYYNRGSGTFDYELL